MLSTVSLPANIFVSKAGVFLIPLHQSRPHRLRAFSAPLEKCNEGSGDDIVPNWTNGKDVLSLLYLSYDALHGLRFVLHDMHACMREL